MSRRNFQKVYKEDNNMKFGDVVRNLRLERGWSQQELADKIGITKMTVSQYETGKRNPSFDRIELIADAFHVDMNYLLGFTDKINRPAGDQTDDKATNKYLAVDLIEIDLVNAWRHADEQTKRIVAYALKIGDMK
jgi:transcriptional regulator with XRE-family HTH domain